MHAYIMTRGIKHKVDQFITELQGKYLPFQYPNKDGKNELNMLQLSVRPIQLWEIVYPAEHNDVVLNTLLNGTNGQTHQKKHHWVVNKIRWLLGVKEIPEYNKANKMPVALDSIEVVGIGVKDDYWVNSKTGEKVNKEDRKDGIEYFEGI